MEMSYLLRLRHSSYSQIIIYIVQDVFPVKEHANLDKLRQICQINMLSGLKMNKT